MFKGFLASAIEQSCQTERQTFPRSPGKEHKPNLPLELSGNKTLLAAPNPAKATTASVASQKSKCGSEKAGILEGCGLADWFTLQQAVGENVF